MPVHEWQMKPSHRCQVLYDVPFKNTKLSEDKLEGKSYALPTMHALYCMCWCQYEGNVRWKSKPSRYEICQSPHKPLRVFYLFHALMLVNIATTIWLKAFPDWEWGKASAYQCWYESWRQAAYHCHISLWTMTDLSVNHQAMVLLWRVELDNSWLFDLVCLSKQRKKIL